MAEMQALVTAAPRALEVYGAGRVDHYAEPGRLDPEEAEADLQAYLRDYEEAEEAQREAREKAERDRDYVDNKQLTQEEVDALTKRGQPPVVLNVVRARAAFLGGMEKKQRRDPKAFPRNNPEDDAAAEAFTDGLRYATETADYPSKRSAAWKNITVEGFGGLELAAVRKRDRMEFTINRIPWDRLFYDPHSSEPDFSDSSYFGQVLWMDYGRALARVLEGGMVDEAAARQMLDASLATAPGTGRTFDDKPREMPWGDKRKRVRIVMMWKRGDDETWTYCEFTKGGVFKKVVAPYLNQDGESYCPWILESANVDRECNRYGEIRHLIDPQDEVNKRRSKGLHLLNTKGVVADEGAVNDVGKARRELARPDFWITKNLGRSLEIVDGAELAAGQAQFAAQAMAYILEAGPNGALLGKGVSDQSGRAIEAQQAGGLVEQSDLMDTLRRLDWRVFKMLAWMMQQFWDSAMWIRVTDNEDAGAMGAVPTQRWVGLNQPMWQAPDGTVAPEHEWKKLAEAGEPLPELYPAANEDGSPMLHNDMARLDMDVMVSDAPDSITLDGETYEALLNLIGTVLGRGLPPAILKLAVEMHPGLPAKRKKQLIDMIDELGNQPPPPGAEDAQRLAREKEEAEIAQIRSTTYKNLTAGEKAMAEAHGIPPMEPPRPDVSEGMSDAPPAQPQGGPARMMPPPEAMASPGPAPMPAPEPQPQPQPGPPVGMMTGMA